MKILVTGSKGQLGYWLKRVFEGHELLLTDREEMDIINEANIKEVVGSFSPDVIIHAAAYTNVDGAEADEKTAFLVNGKGTEYLVNAAKSAGAKVVYISTDYVFDGYGIKPYVEEDKVNPKSIYGKSKLAGEMAVLKEPLNLVVRTAWLYGENGKNFVETMLSLANQNIPVRVVEDQIGCPTYTKDLAEAIKFLIEKQANGIYHVTNKEQCSWYEFACDIFAVAQKQVIVSPVSTAEFPRPAKRPAYSVLSTEKLEKLGFSMRSCHEALVEYIKNRAQSIK